MPSEPPPRVVSLLPGLTDILHDLNLTHFLTSTSHDSTPKINPCTQPKLPQPDLPPSQISAFWSILSHPNPNPPSLDTLLSKSLCSFYTTHLQTLSPLTPTHILTHLPPPKTPLYPPHPHQKPPPHYRLPSLRKILSIHCDTLQSVYQAHRDIAAALHHPDAALHPIASARTALRSLSLRASTDTARPKVAVVLWTDPVYLAGDWVPAVCEIAGARGDGVTREGEPSVAVAVDRLRGVDVLLFAICALGIRECRQVVERFWRENSEWFGEWQGRVVVCDARTLFSRPALGAVVQSARVVSDVVLGADRFGMRGVVWDYWTVPRDCLSGGNVPKVGAEKESSCVAVTVPMGRSL